MRVHMHISFQYVCVDVHIDFVFAFAGIQIYVSSTYIHAIYMYIHVRWHAFAHVYLSWSRRFIFFYFSFLRKKGSFFCYPSVGWQHWALIKKNYSWSCSCYPLCEIINDFIESWWLHTSFLNLVPRVCCLPVSKCTNAHACVWKGGRESSHHKLLQPHTDMTTCSLLTFINQDQVSKSCTDWPVGVGFKWAGLQDALLLERAVWVVPHYWLLPTSKIPLLPWLQGELPKSVSVYLVALMELLASLVLPWERKKKKSPPPSPQKSALQWRCAQITLCWCL